MYPFETIDGRPVKAAEVWKAAVSTFADLPMTGNQDGDVRTVLDEERGYQWDASTSSWKLYAGPGMTPGYHAASHVNGDAIQLATAGQKGLAPAGHIGVPDAHHNRLHSLGGVADHTGQLVDGQHGDRSAEVGILHSKDQVSGIGEVVSIAKEFPGRHFLGTILGYPHEGRMTKSEIQYTRIWLTAGLVITKMVTFVSLGGSAGINVRMGLYDQVNPTSETGVPENRVAQTESSDTAGADGTFLELSLTTSYTVGTSGYYWVAIITDSPSISFAVSDTFREDFLPVRRQSGTGTTLPATAGGLSNPVSAVAFVAAVE